MQRIKSANVPLDVASLIRYALSGHTVIVFGTEQYRS